MHQVKQLAEAQVDSDSSPPIKDKISATPGPSSSDPHTPRDPAGIDVGVDFDTPPQG